MITENDAHLTYEFKIIIQLYLPLIFLLKAITLEMHWEMRAKGWILILNIFQI